MSSRRLILLGAATFALVGVASAGGSISTTLPAIGALPSASSVSPAAEKAQITKNWTLFFSGSTPASKKIQLLQNGQRFAAVIRAQVQSPLAQQTKANVIKVTLSSSTTARVIYTITLAGQPALKNQAGTAVRVGGIWKVGDKSFCALLSLEGTKPPACRRV
jgi:hypothetical protein